MLAKYKAIITAEEKYIRKFVNDIKTNGIGYVKSEVVANKIRAYAPEIEITYNKEERLYTAFYNK